MFLSAQLIIEYSGPIVQSQWLFASYDQELGYLVQSILVIDWINYISGLLPKRAVENLGEIDLQVLLHFQCDLSVHLPVLMDILYD